MGAIAALPPSLVAAGRAGGEVAGSRQDREPAGEFDAIADPCAPASGRDQPPYLAVFSSGPKQIGFLAAMHTQDASSPTFRLIARAFARLQPKIVVVEGVPTEEGLSPARLSNRGFVRRRGGQYGENMQAAYEAEARDIPFIGGEPTQSTLLQAHVEAGANGADVFAAYLLRYLRGAMLARQPGGADDQLRDLQRRLLPTLGQSLGVTDFDIFQWYRASYGVLPAADPELAERGSPCGPGIASAIVARETRLRNEHLLRLIEALSSGYPSVLVVYGAGHFDALAPSLRNLHGEYTLLEAAGPPL
ncbi:hypothetical protein ACIGFJ_14965 [Brevundimonas diminuta]|uniref:hypothetical protein n=1 Tax=Brevundimonas diminuta TaxID=293 RepID=UPI0019912160|nr:hypothetical protein [Brevundimonas diminuta]MBD3818150.1 hypothetical protein [Brevundimonas diminuta]